MAAPAVIIAAKEAGKNLVRGAGKATIGGVDRLTTSEDGSGGLIKIVGTVVAALLLIIVTICSPLGLWDVHSAFSDEYGGTDQTTFSFGGLDDGIDEADEEMFLFYDDMADDLETYAKDKWYSGTGEDVYSTPDFKTICAFCTAVSENDFDLVKDNEDYYFELSKRLLRATSVTRYRSEVCSSSASGAYPTIDGLQVAEDEAQDSDDVIFMRNIEYKTWTVSTKSLQSVFASGTSGATGSLEGLPWVTDEFIETALEIQSTYGIYASVTIAQAQLEVGGTWDGTSLYETAQEANNYFGHKAKTGSDYWQGMCTWDGVSTSASGIYKSYDSVSQCLYDRARLLLTSNYYADVAATAYGNGTSQEQLEALSNSPWCENGYDTLSTIMNAYDLWSLDSAVSANTNSSAGSAIARAAAGIASGCYPDDAVLASGSNDTSDDERTKAYRDAQEWCESTFERTYTNLPVSSDTAVGVAVRLSGVDPDFIYEDIDNQISYMQDSDVWQKIGSFCPETDSPSDAEFEPGDVLVTTQGSGHIEIYVGNAVAGEYFEDAPSNICVYQAQTGNVWPCLTTLSDLSSDGKTFDIYRCVANATERTNIGANAEVEGCALTVELKGELAENYKNSLSSVSIEGNVVRSISYDNDTFVDAVVNGKNSTTHEATTEAQQRIVDACKTVASPAGGLCATWVTWVYRAAGVSCVPYGNANDMWATYCTSTTRSDLQPGMIIAVEHSGSYGESYDYGHVGIYIGDGLVMHSIGFVQTTPLDEWISTYNYSQNVSWGYPGDIE